MSGDDFTLKECLAEFLKGSLTEMPMVEARIMSIQPLKITDDDLHYFEAPGLVDKIQKQTRNHSKGSTQTLILVDWNFAIKKVPNSQEFYIDIEADSFKVFETMSKKGVQSIDDDLTSITEDVDIKYLFERKKRQLLTEMVNAKTHSADTRASNSQQVYESSFGTGAPKINAFGQPVDDMIELGDILKVTSHENSTRPTTEPTVLQNIKVPEMVNKKETFSLDKLGKINSSLTAPVKVEESALLGKRGSILQENEAPELKPAKQIKLSEIYEGFRNGKLSWDQLVFNKETVEYLQRNLNSLLAEN